MRKKKKIAARDLMLVIMGTRNCGGIFQGNQEIFLRTNDICIIRESFHNEFIRTMGSRISLFHS